MAFAAESVKAFAFTEQEESAFEKGFLTSTTDPFRTKGSRFDGADGSEYFVILQAQEGLSLTGQMDDLERRYQQWQGDHGLASNSAVFRRLFFSDLLNQLPQISGHSLLLPSTDNPVAVSLIEQAPFGGSKLALLAYHITGGAPLTKHRMDQHHLLVKHGSQRYVWSTQLGKATAKDAPLSSATETRAVLDALESGLAAQGATMADHCMRTWFYVRSIDQFYQGMVDGRNQVFERAGLTGDTHFITSTGIEGGGLDRYATICMDALSLPDITTTQIHYLTAEDHLCPTKHYNVAFERGTRISFADRHHYYISGTASIDTAGWVVHEGDVIRQADRALINIDALLRSGGATLEDMRYFLVYLRDAADYPAIAAYMARRFPTTPYLIVQGRVCRPEWLIELEGVAVTANNDPFLPTF